MGRSQMLVCRLYDLHSCGGWGGVHLTGTFLEGSLNKEVHSSRKKIHWLLWKVKISHPGAT